MAVVALRAFDHDLQRYRVIRRQDHGGFQDQFFEPRRADLLARGDHRLHPGRSRYHHRAERPVVGQPGVRFQRHASEENAAIGFGQFRLRAQQRMSHRSQPESGRIAGLHRAGQPIAFPLKRIRRQLDSVRGITEGAGPVHVDAVDPGTCQRRDHPGPTAIASAQ